MALQSHFSNQEKPTLTLSNFIEWQTQDVCRFFTQILSKKQIDITKSLLKHQIQGIDLIELTEKNLIELGIQTIHDRKTVIRQIKYLKNNISNTYGIIQVRYNDSITQQEHKIKLKISDNNIKALQTFKQKKCDINEYGLLQSTKSSQRVILSNSILIRDLISPFKIEEFSIIKTCEITEPSTQPNSISSPIRIHRQEMETSLERLISSPAQTIYVQPIDDNDEVIQLNTSGSESQMNLKTSRNTHRTNSKSSTKSKQQSNIKLHRKQRPTQQSINTVIQTNREQIINQSSASNYLQNYITSNRQSHKKQGSQNPQPMPLNNFQLKKNSVTEPTFNYNGNIQGMSCNINSQGTTQTLQGITSNTTNNTGSLSRGNSIKKMKTFCNGSGNGGSNVYANSGQKHGLINNGQQYTSGPNTHNIVSGFTKQGNKKINGKGIKNLNMYSTMNGTHSQTVNKKSQNKENLKEKLVESDTLSDEYGKVINEVMPENNRMDQTPAQSRKDMNHNNQNKLHGSIKQSFVSNQEPTIPNYKQQENLNKKINNLHDIFSDFLDEQSQIQPTSQNKTKAAQKTRAESLHSRQQALLEEDSLESIKKYPDNYQVYLQTEQYQQPENQESQAMHQTQQQLGVQRAVKHMSHKSMYALNSNQLKQNFDSKKQSVPTNNQGKHNQPLHYGTFDNSQSHIYVNQYNGTAMSECGGYNDHIVLNENYNIGNININNSNKYHQRLNTEIDYAENKENIQHKNDRYESGLGKRGGTMGNNGTNAYGRSDSNPTKHKNNRYSDQCDDMLMLDMSEEDSILIKQRF